MAQRLRICLPIQETRDWSLGQEDSLEEGMATHSSILAWRIPRREEPRYIVQFTSVAQPCPTLCDPMDCSTLYSP